MSWQSYGLHICVLVFLGAKFPILSAQDTSTLVVSMEMNSERVVTLPQLQNITLHCELGEKVQWYINDNPMMNHTDAFLTVSEFNATRYNCSDVNEEAMYSVYVTVESDDDFLVFAVIRDDRLYYDRQRSSIGNVELFIGGMATVRVGSTVSASCLPVGQPSTGAIVYNVEWNASRWNDTYVRVGDTLPYDSGSVTAIGMVNGMTQFRVLGAEVMGGVLTISNYNYESPGYLRCNIFISEDQQISSNLLLYWRPVTDHLRSRPSYSGDEGGEGILRCVINSFPYNNLTWYKCKETESVGETKQCMNHCNNMEEVVSGDKFRIDTYPDVTNSIPEENTRLTIRNLQLGDRGCYKCLVDNTVTTDMEYIILRVRGRLLVLWPILGIMGLFLLLAVFLISFSIFNRWKNKQKPPTRSPSGHSEEKVLLEARTEEVVIRGGSTRRRGAEEPNRPSNSAAELGTGTTL